MVTASHNPPRDNGYKVYLAEGRQIVSPIDEEIARSIDSVWNDTIELAPADDPLIRGSGTTPIVAYPRHVPSVRLVPDANDVRVAYTPMHGVGGDMAMAAFFRAGLPAPAVVSEQFDPDADFPTVAFPNPEEPGAMDLLIELAARVGADVAIANDPDADRLGAAIPTPDGRVAPARRRRDRVAARRAHPRPHHGDDRFVVTTLVSSSLLEAMAADAGVHYAETFTGFKWIAKTVLDHPDLRFVFGYEQALGYLVAPKPLDKDGITAAVLFAEVVAVAKAQGVTLQQRLDEHRVALRPPRHGRALGADGRRRRCQLRWPG